MNNIIKNPKLLSKRKNSAILIFSIYSVQLMTSVIIYYLYLISNFYLLWTAIYYVLTFFCAIPQAGFSDTFGRKKHLLIACLGVLISAAYLLFIFLIKKNSLNTSSLLDSLIIIFPVCFFLGVTGNAIPIARAGIADLKIHDFRTAMGWTTTSIGFGWISAVISGIMLPPLGVLIFAILIHLLVIFLIKFYFKDTEDDLFKRIPKKSFSHVIKSSYGWFFSMFLVAGGGSAVVAYFFAETTFYQIYSFDVVGLANIHMKVVGMLMAIGYAFGVLIQWIISNSDRKVLKYGIIISLISLITVFIVKHLIDYHPIIFFTKNSEMIESILTFLFACGYGFSIPALFSLMSRHIEPHHSGKLFGAIDSTDTLALSLTFLTLFLINKIKYFKQNIYVLSLLIFLFSCIFYLIFIKKFSSYEKEK